MFGVLFLIALLRSILFELYHCSGCFFPVSDELSCSSWSDRLNVDLFWSGGDGLCCTGLFHLRASPRCPLKKIHNLQPHPFMLRTLSSDECIWSFAGSGSSQAATASASSAAASRSDSDCYFGEHQIRHCQVRTVHRSCCHSNAVWEADSHFENGDREASQSFQVILSISATHHPETGLSSARI